MPTQFEIGFLVGLLVGEGHFGGDGRQPHVTLRMHVRHEAIFRWLEQTFPGGRVYGPYHHDGRDYFQWMARGPFLRDELAPLLDRLLSPGLDRHSFDRFQLMKTRYPQLATAGEPAASASPDSARTGQEQAATPPAQGSVQASGRRGASSRSGRTAKVTRDPDTLADLFSQLREAWPS